MSFLDNTGLAYFYNKLKGKFIQSVNGETVDSHGNVQINQVALAENLTSPDAAASIDRFIYRTSGGSASLASGEANLVFINGNTSITGRVQESMNVASSTSFNVSIDDADDLREAVGNTTGTYVLTYTAPTSSTATSSWEPDVGSWTYDSESTTLAAWGLTSDELVAPSLSVDVSGITSATVVPDTFMSMVGSDVSTDYVFTYSGTAWELSSDEVTLSDYGISITGTPSANDSITVTCIHGTPTTTATISFTAYDPGVINVATPSSFEATGFNQFDKATMYIENATIDDGTIVANTGTYVCYCRAVGGEHGYIAESIGGHIDTTGGMGWCAAVPEIGSTVVTTSADNSDSVTEYAADFTYMTDGYMVVVVDDMDDLMMWCEWSGDVNGQTEYTAYSAPSTITIPTVGTIEGTQYYLPTYTYGMPRLGNVYDTINFESSTYIKRIERLAYSAENLAIVQAMSPVPVYDYDDTNIFYVLADPITYSFTNPTGGIYIVDDHGTEEFTDTSVPVEAELLYGQNLRDKLRTDVLTISKQNPDLSNAQLNQVYENLNLASFHLSGTITSFPFTIQDERISARSSVVNVVLGTPASVISDLSWSTGEGIVSITGTLASSSSTTIDFDIAPTITALGQWNNNVTPDSGAGDGGGYCKFPDGTLIQWGSTTIPSGDYTHEFTLPIGLYKLQESSILLTPVEVGTDYNVNYSSSTNSKIQIGRTPNTIANTYYWTVFGRWKA